MADLRGGGSTVTLSSLATIDEEQEAMQVCVCVGRGCVREGGREGSLDAAGRGRALGSRPQGWWSGCVGMVLGAMGCGRPVGRAVVVVV